MLLVWIDLETDSVTILFYGMTQYPMYSVYIFSDLFQFFNSLFSFFLLGVLFKICILSDDGKKFPFSKSLQTSLFSHLPLLQSFY